MQTRRISFPNASGNILAAYLDLPLDGEPIAYALFAHCFTCGKSLKATRYISQALTAARIGVLRFDFTGIGESEGDFAGTSFSSDVEDLVSASRFLESEYAAPSILIGHSLGGTAALRAALDIPSVKAVATIAAPDDPQHAKHLLEPSEKEGDSGEVTIAGKSFRAGKRFLAGLGQHEMSKTLRRLGRALLIFHSPVDEVVGIDHASRIFMAAMHPKSFVSLDHGDHLLSDPRDAAYVGSVIAAWAGKYLPVPEQATPRSTLEDNRVIVTNEGDTYRCDVMVRGHVLTADEPRSAGGSDTGPTPYDLVVAGLGACTAMTLRMVAMRKQWPLDSVTVRLTHAKIHAEDCPECDQSTAMIDRIDREIEVTGPLDEEQRSKLLDIAEKCPVHRTLHSEVLIKTQLAE